MDTDSIWAQAQCGKLLMPLNYSIIDTSKIPSGLTSKCAVPAMQYGFVLVYNKKKYGSNPPTGCQEVSVGPSRLSVVRPCRAMWRGSSSPAPPWPARLGASGIRRCNGLRRATAMPSRRSWVLSRAVVRREESPPMPAEAPEAILGSVQ
ncbi:hypothetical protein OG607_06475 [Streptomyces sp. NBC_01537]|uniref:hypothetical protein n=1 Tax=Streptomyces sp. NBC_01537 TaxID=2903896 RepID=UPI00386F35FD